MGWQRGEKLKPVFPQLRTARDIGREKERKKKTGGKEGRKVGGQ